MRIFPNWLRHWNNFGRPKPAVANVPRLIDTLSTKMGFVTPKIPEPANWRNDVPILIVTAGKDYVPYINPSNADFVAKAITQNLPVTLINYSTGQHGFDALNDNETTRAIIKNTLDFWRFHLKP